MPSSVLQSAVELVLQAVFEFGCYYVGRVVVPVISLGRWKCDRLTTDVPRHKLRGSGLYHVRGERVYLTSMCTQLVGLITVGLLAGGGALIWYWSPR